MARKTSPQVSTERREAAPADETQEPTEFDRFRSLARRLVRIPKSEIDKARAEDDERRNGHK